MAKQKIDMTALFEDLYRARMRKSLYEFDAVLAQIEALPKPHTPPMLLLQQTLRGFFGEALPIMESQLAELRARYAELPALPTKKESEEEV